MDTLVTSSPKTLRWLNTIKSNIKKKISSVEYNEAKYWASFKNPTMNRNVVILQPYKNQIRVFTKLPLSFDTQLEVSPSSGRWLKSYPTIFKISSEQDIEKATYLIVNSYRFDLHQ